MGSQQGACMVDIDIYIYICTWVLLLDGHAVGCCVG